MSTQWTPTFAGNASVPSVGWMLSRSAWLLFVFIGGGWFGWVGFALIGALVARVGWLITAGVYAVASFGALFVQGAMQPVVVGLIHTAAIIHGLILNRTFLITLWGRRERGERQLGRGVPVSIPSAPQVLARPVRLDPGMPPEAAALFANTGTQQSDYLQPAAQAPHGAVPAATTPTPAPTRARKSHGLDVNTATAEQLAALPHIGAARAAFAISARQRTPFTSTQNFADVLGLQPHEFVALRGQITSTQPRKSRPAGRRLDL